MSILLGIDTGGTFTDAVLFDDTKENDNRIIAKSKALTSHAMLSEGIGKAIENVLNNAPSFKEEDISLVSMSTTLATNALVEGQGGKVALIFIGFDDVDLERTGLQETIKNHVILSIAGGHDPYGNEKAPLDYKALERACLLAKLDNIEAFAIVSQFAIRNPDHEIKACEFLSKKTGLPITCGYELSSQLNGPKRAVTAVYNAQLLNKITHLISATHEILERLKINAPLMVVRGDGTLVSAAFAKQRPIETILSGPAASVIGAFELTGEKNALISDIGGTTTDIAVIENGEPKISPNGATVGGIETMVEAVDMSTFGIGGDSEVSIELKGLSSHVSLGPKRAIPLCLLAHNYYDLVHHHLDNQLAQENTKASDARFIIPNGKLSIGSLSNKEQALVEKIGEKPISFAEVITKKRENSTLNGLVQKGVMSLSSFTPTDAMHCLGALELWDQEASVKAAEILSRRKNGRKNSIAENGTQFSNHVISALTRNSSKYIFSVSLKSDNLAEHEMAAQSLIDIMFEPNIERQTSFIRLGLSKPLIATGASAHLYYPNIAKNLDTTAIIPTHADVANAIGAVAGKVKIRTEFTLSRPNDDVYRLHMHKETKDFSCLNEAKQHAEQSLSKHLTHISKQAGANHVDISFEWLNNWARIEGQKTLISAQLKGAALGKPAIKKA